MTVTAEALRRVERLKESRDEAERKAWLSLAGYKFLMFGYHAAQWVTLNKVIRDRRPNPWKDLVTTARERCIKEGH